MAAERAEEHIVGAHVETSLQGAHVHFITGLENGGGLLDEAADLILQSQRPRGGDQAAPARTGTESPKAARTLVRVRLMATGLRCMRFAAPTTLPSSSRASRAISRFMSGKGMMRGSVGQ